VADTILLLLSEESLSLPMDEASRLVLKLRPVPGALTARAKIERAVSMRAAGVSFNRAEKKALLHALDAWFSDSGLEGLGPELVDIRGALEYDLGAA
jgi:hypothetical protein